MHGTGQAVCTAFYRPDILLPRLPFHWYKKTGFKPAWPEGSVLLTPGEMITTIIKIHSTLIMPNSLFNF